MSEFFEICGVTDALRDEGGFYAVPLPLFSKCVSFPWYSPSWRTAYYRADCVWSIWRPVLRLLSSRTPSQGP